MLYLVVIFVTAFAVHKLDKVLYAIKMKNDVRMIYKVVDAVIHDEDFYIYKKVERRKKHDRSHSGTSRSRENIDDDEEDVI